MKNTSCFLLAGCLLLGQFADGLAMNIVKDGQARCCIRIDPALANRPVVNFAAEELIRYVKQMSGVTLAVGTSDQEPAIHLSLAPGVKTSAGFNGNDGYILKGSEQRIEIQGVTERSVLYGVYGLLEEFGCRWYEIETKDEVVPKKPELIFNGKIESRASLPLRALCWDCPHVVADMFPVADWMAKNRYNWLEVQFTNSWAKEELLKNLEQRGIELVLANHTMDSIFKLDDLWKTRPELFAEVGGKRGRKPGEEYLNGIKLQFIRPCFANEEVMDIIAGQILALVDKYPQLKIIGLTPQDGVTDWCDCAACRRIQPEVKCSITDRQSRTDQYWYFAKGVMERVWKKKPHLQVLMWTAYQYSDLPLKEEHLLPADKVIIMVDNYSRCHVHDMDSEKCKTGKDWYGRSNYRILASQRKWLEKYPGRVYLWNELPAPFDWNLGRQGAFPRHKMIQHDLQLYAQQGVIGAIQNRETSMNAPSGLYVTGRLLWDLKTDLRELKQDFYLKYYGPVQKEMEGFFAETGEWPFGFEGHDSYRAAELEKPLEYRFDEETIGKLEGWLKKATEQADNEEPYLARVRDTQARFKTFTAWVRLHNARRAVEAAMKLPAGEREGILQSLRSFAAPYYSYLESGQDPAARQMKNSLGGGLRKMFLTGKWYGYWKPSGEIPKTPAP